MHCSEHRASSMALDDGAGIDMPCASFRPNLGVPRRSLANASASVDSSSPLWGPYMSGI